MTNLLILSSKDEADTVSSKVMANHDIVIQAIEDTGMYTILKSRGKTRRAKMNWPDVCKLRVKLETEIAEA